MNIEYPIIFMSGNALQSDIIDAWHGGAIDFLLKPFSGVQVSHALKALFYKAEQIKNDMAEISMAQKIIEISISKREAEVLLLLGKGYRQAKVAEILNITLRTVKMHRANLKSKLNLNTLIELNQYYLKYKLSIESMVQN